MRKLLSPFIAALVVFVAGIGEYWIRYTVAHDICARVIGLDARGNVTMSFNTTGMGRGYVGADGKPTIMFTADDGK